MDKQAYEAATGSSSILLFFLSSFGFCFLVGREWVRGLILMVVPFPGFARLALLLGAASRTGGWGAGYEAF